MIMEVIYGADKVGIGHGTVVGIGYIGTSTWVISVNPPLSACEQDYLCGQGIIRPSQLAIRCDQSLEESYICLGNNFSRAC